MPLRRMNDEALHLCSGTLPWQINKKYPKENNQEFRLEVIGEDCDNAAKELGSKQSRINDHPAMKRFRCWRTDKEQIEVVDYNEILDYLEEGLEESRRHTQVQDNLGSFWPTQNWWQGQITWTHSIQHVHALGEWGEDMDQSWFDTSQRPTRTCILCEG